MANPLPSIGVDQPPFGGDSYPLVDPPAAAAGILADLYLAYVESSSPYALPLRVAWMYGFGDQAVSPPAGYPTPAHDRDLLIVDDLGRTVFDSTQAEDYFEDAWGSHYRIIEWRNGRQILRVVQRLGSAANTDQYLTPAAVINARAIKRIRPQLTGLLVNEQLVDAAEIVLAAGYNMRLDVERLPVVEGRKRVTRITLNAIPGEGEGRFPECSGDNRYLRSLMGQRPDGRGHLVLSGDECYRVTVPYEVVDGVAQVTPHTLKIVNDCTPCADCNDHIRVYRAVSNIHDQQAATYVQLDETRAAHQENIARWNAQKACREQRNQRLVVVSQEGGVVAVAGAFSNTTEECLWDVEFRFTFRVLNGGSPVPPANRQPNLVAGSTHAGGTNLDGTVPYSLGGTWPAWFTRYDQVASGDTNFVRFGLTFTPEPGDALEVTFTTHSPHGAGIGLPAVGVSGAIEDLWTTTPNGPAIAVTKRLVPLYPGTPGSPGGGSGGSVPEHTHPMEDVENLVEALAGKANVIHSHTMEDVSGLSDALAGKANVIHSHAMEDVSGLGDALAGKANVIHSHTMEDVSGLSDALAGKANVSHGHEIEDIDGLEDILTGKANVIHGHAAADVTSGTFDDARIAQSSVTQHQGAIDHGSIGGLNDDDHGHYALKDGTRWTSTQTANRVAISDANGHLVCSDITTTELDALDGIEGNIETRIKALENAGGGSPGGFDPNCVIVSDGSGNLVASSITTTELGHLDGVSSNIQTQLDGKSDTGHGHAIADVTGLADALDGKAASSHGHTIADVAGLQTALDAKAASSHGHAIADVTGLADALAGKANVSHGHAISDVTGLQTALAGKANVSHGHAIADVTGLQTALAAALTKAVNTVTTSGSLTTANRTVLANNSAAITLNLPPAATMAGDYLIVKKISNNAHTVTLDPNGSETIDGATTYVLYVVGDYVIIQSDGSNWRVIGGYALPHQCVMRRTTAKSIASTTITLIDGLTVMADTAALAGTDKIVIRRTGRYLIVVSGDGPTFSTSDIWQIYAYRGAAAYGTASATGAAITTTSALSGVFAANLTAGDEITLRALQYNPGTDARDLSNATLAVLEQR